MCPMMGGCGVTFALVLLGWLLIASALVWQAWNRVICHVWAQPRTVRYWQALLLIVTVCVLCAPRTMRHCGGHIGSGKDCCAENKECCQNGGQDCCKDKGAKK